MIPHFVEKLQKELALRIIDKEQSVVFGDLNQENYKFTCGWIQGLKQANSLVKEIHDELVKNLHKDLDF